MEVYGKVGILLGLGCACVVTMEDFGIKHSSLGSGSITFHVLGFCSGTWASYPAVAQQGFGVGRNRKGGLCPPRSLSTSNIQSDDNLVFLH